MAQRSVTVPVTVNNLSDNILREVFAFCLSNHSPHDSWHMVIWQRLVQVCQRWQQIIYGSPKYLDLHLYCSPAAREPFRKHHSHWPDFPLILNYQIGLDEDEAVDCLVAALEHSNRVHHLDLYIGSWDSRVYEVLERMRVSFPALTHLKLEGPDTYDKHNIYDISRNFLGNIAPCLQHIHLDRISFQELLLRLHWTTDHIILFCLIFPYRDPLPPYHTQIHRTASLITLISLSPHRRSSLTLSCG